jgi:hypothetical protein
MNAEPIFSGSYDRFPYEVGYLREISELEIDGREVEVLDFGYGGGLVEFRTPEGFYSANLIEWHDAAGTFSGIEWEGLELSKTSVL